MTVLMFEDKRKHFLKQGKNFPNDLTVFHREVLCLFK